MSMPFLLSFPSRAKRSDAYPRSAFLLCRLFECVETRRINAGLSSEEKSDQHTSKHDQSPS